MSSAKRPLKGSDFAREAGTKLSSAIAGKLRRLTELIKTVDVGDIAGDLKKRVASSIKQVIDVGGIAGDLKKPPKK